MHSNWRYKIRICLVILGQVDSVLKLQGPQYFFIFPKLFRYNFYVFGDENFSIPLSIENFRFSFSTKNSLTWGVESEKLNEKIVGNLFQ